MRINHLANLAPKAWQGRRERRSICRTQCAFEGLEARLCLASFAFEHAPRSPFPVGDAPNAVAVGVFDIFDFLAPDLVTANELSGDVSLLLNEDATEIISPAPGSPFPTGTNFGSGPGSITVNLFNGDGFHDVAVAILNDDQVRLLLGDGDGGMALAPGGPLPVGDNPQSIAAGDFNGDNQPDLVTANASDDSVSVLLNSGGGFGPLIPLVSFPVGDGPQSVAVGDFNGDGFDDVATANSLDGTVSLLLSDGDGGFLPFVPITPVIAGDQPWSVAVGDFNNDNLLDLATANRLGNDVSVLLGNGAGGLVLTFKIDVGDAPNAVAVADFDSDGQLDLVTANGGSGDLSVLLAPNGKSVIWASF
jgi:hypothetical protein